MDESEKTSSLKYRVEFDPTAHRRITKAFIRQNLGLWVQYSLKYSLILGGLFFLVAILVMRIHATLGPFEAQLYAGLLGIPVAFIWVFSGIRNQLDSADRTHAGLEWDCELLEDTWFVRQNNGYTYSIPWNLMKLQQEHPEGWYILIDRKSESYVTVYRKPLQDAGLEEEFRRRASI